MAKSSANQTLMLAAVGMGGYLLWRKLEADKTAAATGVTVTPTPTPTLPPVINITLPASSTTPTTPTTTVTPTTPLTPVVNITPPPASNVVQTPYGPVLTTPITTGTQTNTPSAANPAAGCMAINPTWGEAACNTRIAEIPFRWQYISSGIASGRTEQAKYPPGNPAIAEIQGRLDDLASKGAALQAEYRSYTGGTSIPEGILSDPTRRAAYIAWLQARSWHDATIGV